MADHVDLVVDAAEIGINVDLIDLVTGTGEAAILASRRGATVIGLDPSPERLEIAAAAAVAFGVPVDWMLGTPDSIPCPEESMDRVISVGGLDGVDPERAAAEIMRVLRPGGTFVFSATGPLSDEARVRAVLEPYGVELTFRRLDGALLTRGRRRRSWDS